jgi:hypothetical protein
MGIEKCRELAKVSGVGGNGKRAETLLDFQVVDE